MNRKTIVFAVVLTASANICSQVPEKDLFVSPMRELPSLSASFAELRSDHFHSGLDYKTGGVTGKDVLAVDEGYVYRIAVSPTGFGKAVYVRHPSGYSSLYGHLRSFRPDIEEYVKKRQYELKSFSVSLFPQRDQFRVARGEVIAWSGNTGGSSGPHLHFELRESSSEDPVNPLMFDLGVSDRVRPVIEKVILYPLSRHSSVNRSFGSRALRTVPSNGSYGVTSGEIPLVYGETGIGIKCWDSFDNSANKCGVYSIEMLVDGMKMYGFTADRFAFSESRYINSHIDYAAKATGNEYIHRLYLQPGNKLSMYDRHAGRGVLRFSDDGEHEIKITVTDTHGNKSWVSFRVRSVSQPPVSPTEMSCSKILPYGRASDFSADGIRLQFPAGTLYDTLFFVYKTRNHTRTFLSPIHSVHNETVAVHDRFRLSIRPDTVIAGMEARMCLAQVSTKGIVSYSGGEFKYGYVSGDVNRLGDYTVTIDSVPPVIKPSFVKSANLTGRQSFTVTITDDFAGIKSYETLIDGEWALAEYDAKNNLLIYRPEKIYLKENTLHRMELTVTDNRGNSSVLKSEFKW
jgi:hypothetical protein